MVVTRTDDAEDDDSPQDKVNINVDRCGSILLLITRFNTVLLLAGTIVIKDDDATERLRLNDDDEDEELLRTVHAEVHCTLVLTSPVKTNLICGFTYVMDCRLEVIKTVGMKVSAAVGTAVDG